MNKMMEIVRILSRTYTDRGIAIFLDSQNTVLGARPIDLCKTDEGLQLVQEYAENLL